MNLLSLGNKQQTSSSAEGPNAEKKATVGQNDKGKGDKNPNNVNNTSVTDIMSFITDKMNKDIQKKIRDMPEALPLIRRISHMNTQEDDLFKKVRIG